MTPHCASSVLSFTSKHRLQWYELREQFECAGSSQKKEEKFGCASGSARKAPSRRDVWSACSSPAWMRGE